MTEAKTITITLDSPIGTGDAAVSTVNLRKPMAGDLRGLSLEDILNAKYDDTAKLITRIASPVLAIADVDAMELMDFANIAGEIRGFFMTSSQRAVAEKMIAEAQAATLTG